MKSYSALRIELAPNYVEVERARENFPLTYLPEEAEVLFKEALGCYAASLYDAFGSMCRRTAQSLFRELGERGKLELFDTLQEIRTLAELDDDTFAELRSVLFGSDTDPWPNHPRLDAERAGILLEVMRDLLYQTFVRKARLLQAMSLRKSAAGRARRRRSSDPRDGSHSRSPQPEKRAHCGTGASSRRPRPIRAGAQECCTVRNTRSGCGMSAVTRPSALHTPATPAANRSDCRDIAPSARRDYRRTASSPRPPRAACRARRGAEFREPLAVRHHDRQHRAVHAARAARNSSAAPAPGTAAPRTARSGCARSAASSSAPGISSLSAASIWQPLHTPRVNVASRSKKAANSSRARGLNRIDLAQPSPAPSTSP